MHRPPKARPLVLSDCIPPWAGYFGREAVAAGSDKNKLDGYRTAGQNRGREVAFPLWVDNDGVPRVTPTRHQACYAWDPRQRSYPEISHEWCCRRGARPLRPHRPGQGRVGQLIRWPNGSASALGHAAAGDGFKRLKLFRSQTAGDDEKLLGFPVRHGRLAITIGKIHLPALRIGDIGTGLFDAAGSGEAAKS